MNDDIELELTSDGSHTLYIPSLDEHYHSVNGAIQESMHVFIEAGLNRCVKHEISVLEIGFGTGLNAFLTYLNAKEKQIDYTGVELYPLGKDILDKLNYAEKESNADKQVYADLHNSEWDMSTQITPTFYLTKLLSDFRNLDFNSDRLFDVVYFDAFAPDKQPDMWTQEIFDRLYGHTSEGGVLTTYCAKGSVRRMMQQAGYAVERLPGPPGKREMLRATKI